MRVVEIFDSISGEGPHAGGLSTFIRLAGCNLRCAWCDTPYALSFGAGEEMDVQAVRRSTACRHVTLTGGEPLSTPDAVPLVEELLRAGHEVEVETNGSFDIAPLVALKGCSVTMDWKMPSSGCPSGSMRPANLSILRPCDCLKLVLARGDLPEVWSVLETVRPETRVYLSPVFGKIDPAEIVELMKAMADAGRDMDSVRLQLQMHKIVWGPERRGV